MKIAHLQWKFTYRGKIKSCPYFHTYTDSPTCA